MKVFLILFLFGNSLLGFGQGKVFDLPRSYSARISALAKSIQKENRSNLRTAKLLFRKAHKGFLKDYNAYSNVEEIFERGKYDCLSGTYFLSLCLSELGIKHRIIETNYHIFLIVETAQGEALLESTDRLEGFVTDKNKIEERICGYRNSEVEKSRQLYLSGVKIYREILPNQLPGLLYFNQAVKSFHKNDLIQCIANLEKAWKIYDNPRIYEFTPILVHSISQSQLDEKQKANFTAVLKAHQRLSMHALANR